MLLLPDRQTDKIIKHRMQTIGKWLRCCLKHKRRNDRVEHNRVCLPLLSGSRHTHTLTFTITTTWSFHGLLPPSLPLSLSVSLSYMAHTLALCFIGLVKVLVIDNRMSILELRFTSLHFHFSLSSLGSLKLWHVALVEPKRGHEHRRERGERLIDKHGLQTISSLSHMSII